jgi:Leucine-rich repeat (LRR) protein
MTPEEAYDEALRRIRQTEKTGALKLDLSGWKEGKATGLETLTRLPPELERLTSLQSLDLRHCKRLSNLSPLAGLTSLQLLDLSECDQLKNLYPLDSLASLKDLDLSGCSQLSGDLSPLASLASLRWLNLYGCGQLSGDLWPLALASLWQLNLYGCGQLSGDLWPLSLTSLLSLNPHGCGQLSSDLSPLAGLTKLRKLSLSGCLGIGRFAPLESLLPTLKELYLFECELDDLPPKV